MNASIKVDGDDEIRIVTENGRRYRVTVAGDTLQVYGEERMSITPLTLNEWIVTQIPVRTVADIAKEAWTPTDGFTASEDPADLAPAPVSSDTVTHPIYRDHDVGLWRCGDAKCAWSCGYQIGWNPHAAAVDHENWAKTPAVFAPQPTTHHDPDPADLAPDTTMTDHLIQRRDEPRAHWACRDCAWRASGLLDVRGATALHHRVTEVAAIAIA